MTQRWSKRLTFIIPISLAAIAFGCADEAQPARAPTATTPEGTQVPLPTEDGELEEGETEMTIEEPNGDEKSVEVEVDDD